MPSENRGYGMRVIVAALLTLACPVMKVYAQEARIEAQVTYIAGQNIYLDAGQDQGIQTGDTLGVYREAAPIGRFVVVSSTATRSVVTFADAPFPVTLGVRLQIQPPALPDVERPEASPDLAEETTEPETRPERTTPRTRAASTAGRRGSGIGPRVAGRVMLSVNTLQSSTSWNVGAGGVTKRTFVTPSLNLHTTVSNLPQGFQLRTRLRADYRYSSGRAVMPEASVRVYDVLLEKDFTRFSVQAGRFSNSYAPYGGYWDGALIHFGSKKNGFGTAIGFMPDQSNEGFSSEMPRYAGFAHIEVGQRSGPRYAAEVSFNEIRPTNDLLDHRFFGLSHTLQWGGYVSLRNDLQLDRNPETGDWIPSRFSVRGSVAPHRRLRLYSRFTIRQPYSIWRIQRIISYRRDQASAGLSWQIAQVTVGGDVSLNYVDDGLGGRVEDGRTFSGYLQMPKTPLLQLGFSATASYWSDDVGSTFFLNAGTTRAFGRARTRLHYQFYRTATLGDPLLTHAVSFQAVVPLAHRFFTSSQVRLQQSSTLRSVALYTSLWYSF